MLVGKIGGGGKPRKVEDVEGKGEVASIACKRRRQSDLSRLQAAADYVSVLAGQPLASHIPLAAWPEAGGEQKEGLPGYPLPLPPLATCFPAQSRVTQLLP